MYYIGVLKNIHLADFWKPILLFIAQLSAFLSSQSPHTTLTIQQARQITHKLYKHIAFLVGFGITYSLTSSKSVEFFQYNIFFSYNLNECFLSKVHGIKAEGNEENAGK
jgi:hypothetical protein